MLERNNFYILFVLGPPGSGKGTQIKLLAEKLGLLHFISSDVGKDYIESHNDQESKKQKERYNKGLLFEPEWMLKVVKEKTEEILKNRANYNGVAYDGSPRTLYEAENLYKFLVEKLGEESIKIIEIDANEEELRERIRKRKRDIDKEEVFNVRIRVYKEETLPALEFLKKNHEVITINGNQSVEEVHKEIMQKLNNDHCQIC